MTRGTFANVRIKNLMVPGVEGGVTKHRIPVRSVMPIYNASVSYQHDGVPLVIFAGQEYGTGSSRDWAAKGTRLLGGARGDRGEFRAYPSLESGGNGCACRCNFWKE